MATIVGMIIAILGTLITVYKMVSKSKEDINKQFGGIFKQLTKLKERVTRIETKTDLFWNWIEREMPRILKNPGNSTKDSLLDKMCKNDITSKEVKELKGILEKELKEKDGTIVIAYSLVLARLDQKIEEI